MRLLLTPAVLLPLLLAGAGPEAAQVKDYPIAFSDVTRKAGLIEPLAGIMGHGGAWGDFDGDGRIDLFVGGFCDRPETEYTPAKGPVASVLLRNRGDGTFEVVKGTPAAFYARTSGALFADLDNDGRLELYAANNAKRAAGKLGEPQRSAQLRHSLLFHNKGGKLIDVSDASAACPPGLYTARNIGVLDYDNDGLLDLLVVEDMFVGKGGTPRTTLLRNRGGMKFEDVNKKVGIPDGVYGLGCAVADLNGDGRPDFFIAHSNRLFLSRKDGTYFEDPGLTKLFAWKPANREDWPCGAAFGDLNRDGKLDLVLTIHSTQARNKVYLNMGIKDGVPQFRDATDECGLGETVPIRCPHVEIQDLDNDGWPDIYVSAAWLDGDKVTPLVYRNLGAKDGVPRFVAPRPIKAPMVYCPAGPSGDFDNDGRLDLFLINWFQGNHCRLLRNESPKKHWLDVRVTGKKMNRMGIGAVVRLYRAGELGKAAALLGCQEMTTGYGYASGQPAVCHFGLGDIARVDVEVTLPTGARVTRPNVAADQSITISEQ